jgi:hypothetical protein
MKRFFGWLIVGACCVVVAESVPGIIGDVAPVFAGACGLLALLETLR